MIEIRQLQKHYGSHRVLHGVDLDVAKGEVVCLIGPSGSGKSTLLRCINALEAYDGGMITVFGETVQRGSKTVHALRSRMGMVFQRFNLFPHRTVLENVMEGPVYVKGEPPQQVREEAVVLLEKVGLSAKADAYPEQLSGGQQQRVAIARSLCMQPELMLFDEPTSALDPEMIREVLDVIRELADEGMTLICVTHEMGFARQVADRVLFMDEGKIIESAPPAQLFSTPAHPRTRAFLEQVLSYHG